MQVFRKGRHLFLPEEKILQCGLFRRRQLVECVHYAAVQFFQQCVVLRFIGTVRGDVVNCIYAVVTGFPFEIFALNGVHFIAVSDFSLVYCVE